MDKAGRIWYPTTISGASENQIHQPLDQHSIIIGGNTNKAYKETAGPGAGNDDGVCHAGDSRGGPRGQGRGRGDHAAGTSWPL